MFLSQLYAFRIIFNFGPSCLVFKVIDENLTSTFPETLYIKMQTYETLQNRIFFGSTKLISPHTTQSGFDMVNGSWNKINETPRKVSYSFIRRSILPEAYDTFIQILFLICS